MTIYHQFKVISKQELEQIEDALREAQWKETTAQTGAERMLFAQMIEALKIALRIADDAENEIEVAQNECQQTIDSCEETMDRLKDWFKEIKEIADRGIEYYDDE
jgi:hypothetical protein